MPRIRIVAARHGYTVPLPQPVPLSPKDLRDADLARQLTSGGYSDAVALSGRLAGIPIDRVVCSCAERAIQTAEAITALSRSHDDFHIEDALYIPDNEDGRAISEMAALFPDEAAEVYLSCELNCRNPGEYPLGPVGRFAREAGRALVKHLRSPWPNGPNVENVLVVGHAVLTPLAVYGLLLEANGASDEVRERLLQLKMEPASAFSVIFNAFDTDHTRFELM